MRKGIIATVGLAVLLLGVGLTASPLLAKSKCPKECKAQFVSTDKACKTTCKALTDKKAKKACKKTCATTFKSEKTKCKTATNPVFPACSPSGAFVD